MALFENEQDKEHFRLLLRDTMRDELKEYHHDHMEVHKEHDRVHQEEIRPTLRELKAFKLEVRTAGAILATLTAAVWGVVKGWIGKP